MARWFVDRCPRQGIPSVSLRRLLPDAQFLGCQDWEVSGCTSDSRRLDPGQVFVAVRGAKHDGHAFVAQALERGAAGVVV
ncbi:Mur ligase domain-containing protein, partial [Singulisphaera rosea]